MHLAPDAHRRLIHALPCLPHPLPPPPAPAEIAGLRAELRTELQELRTEVHQGHTALEQVRAELLRWMFGLWVTTFIGVAGLLISLGDR